MESQPIVFGPVPSRRLSKSIGVNNIPPKVCSFACVYCQVGRTFEMTAERRAFYQPEKIIRAVDKKINISKKAGEQIDYLTIVPDGEPTLDIHLGELIRGLKQFGFPVAVITNSTLLSDKYVRDEISLADYVSVKLDGADHETIKKVNRPVKTLNFKDLIEGMIQFSKFYQGELVSESMFVRELNDTVNSIEGIADLLVKIAPKIAYIATPTRPTAIKGILPAHENVLTAAYRIFADHELNPEFLINYEGDSFSASGDVRSDLLSITSVHPMRKSAVIKLLEKSGQSWQAVVQLMEEGLISDTSFGNEIYFTRKLKALKTE